MKIQELLSTEQRWTRGANARDAEGQIVMYDSVAAQCWCLSGAVLLCYPGDRSAIKFRLLDAIRTIYGSSGVVYFNDDSTTTFAMVRKVIEKADI